MMGSNDKPQDEFFYSFNLEEVVPADHLLRSIDRFLDLSDLREHLAPFYSHTGRPSVDPELMIRMLIVESGSLCCRQDVPHPVRQRRIERKPAPTISKKLDLIHR